MTALYQIQEIRQLEQWALEAGITEYQLMVAAGEAAFNALITRWPEAKHIAVCAGRGNNGGDGFVIARLAHEYGLQVSLYLIEEQRSSALTPSTARAAEACKALGLVIQPWTSPFTLLQTDVIVDALLGIGISGTLKKTYCAAIDAINTAGCPVLAVDIPSGIHADTGAICGYAIKADLTVTFIGLKRGLYTATGPMHAGNILCCSLGIPFTLYNRLTPTAELLDGSHIHTLLPKRPKDSHKGSYGHVLVIGGDYGMGGAVRMAAEAAARVGSGLVTVATRPEHVPIVSGARPELMCHQVARDSDLEPLLKRASVIVIGPGLGKTEWAKSLLNTVLDSSLPKVLDADALNLLSLGPVSRADWVLTPHLGEAARLLNCSTQAIQDNRFNAIHDLQQKYHGVIVLKGSGTLIKNENPMVFICPAGNPGMASGGMGDILSGVIGGLLAQGLNLLAAAKVGVFVHSMAADRAAQEGGERGLLATDLLPYLRNLVNPC